MSSEEKTNSNKKENNLNENLIIPKKQMFIAVIILFALIVVSAFLIMQFSNQDDNPVIPANGNETGSEDRLPFIKIFLLETNCEECLSLDSLIESIKLLDVNVLEVKRIQADSKEGQDLIKMHDIKFLPTLIVNGEFQGTQLQEEWDLIGEEKNGVLIASMPPYYSLEEEKLIGKVKVLLIKNSDCNDCVDLSSFAQDLKASGILVDEERTIEFDSEEAQELFESYLIDRVPVVLIGGDIAEYQLFSFFWVQAGGTIESDNAFTYRQAVPYFDLFSEETKGLVEVTRLIDSNCFNCFDVSELVVPLEQMGMKIIKDSTIEVSSPEGIALKEKYAITIVPTIIVSSQAEEYIDFFVVWPEVGSIEEDNNFVFRNYTGFEGEFVELE